MGKTVYDRIYESHLIDPGNEEAPLLFVDRHLTFEVTSPQAFEGLRNAGRKVRRVDCTLATVDHNVPTSDRSSYKDSESFIQQADSRTQVMTLEKNVKDFGLSFFGLADRRQGIVHVIGPEQGFTLPGTVIVCGDSHTSTHGAFGALAFGIGTSEVEHVLATQTLPQKKSKNMRVRVEGKLAEGVHSKDIILYVIGKIGTAGGTGCVIEYSGSTIRSLSMEARMSICNMTVEGGARAGLVAPDETTYAYLKDKPLAPKGKEWDQAVAYWKTLVTDDDAHFDITVDVDAKDIEPTVSWGTSPQDVVPISGTVPDPANFDKANPQKAATMRRALKYIALEPNTPMKEVKLDKVFIGSCTNSRIEDLRSAARIVRGRKVAAHVQAMVVPGSGLVRHQAQREGLDRVFKDAGFDWREAGCSMCLGMNPDILSPGDRCASTSNRNFEGRQGPGGRTHLCSPAMAAAAAIKGYLTDVREFLDDATAPPTEKTSSPAVAVGEDEIDEEDKVDDLPEQSAGATRPKNDEASGPKAASTGMPEFKVLKGTAAPMELTNVDTDLIIPKQFLKTIKRTGLKAGLFYEIAYKAGTEEEDPDFILNKEPWRHSKILACSGANFGCGSSREHAPWALLDFGIKCILAPSFADIFFNNCFKNGMLPIPLDDESIANVMEEAKAGREVEVDLPAQVIRSADGRVLAKDFEVDPFRKHCLIHGLDDIGITLQQEAKITAFEEKRRKQFPWLDGKVGAHILGPRRKRPAPKDW